MSYRVGCSGWSYRHWRDSFYPPGLRQKDWFPHYSSIFDTVEINNSFYRTPTPEMFKAWGERVQESFIYAVKVNRAITQYHKLDEYARDLFEQFVQRAEQLGPTLGPLLLQLPPSLGRDDRRLSDFLGVTAVRRRRIAMEFRRDDWFTEEVYTILRHHRVALVVSDLGKLPVAQVATTDWVYARFHGSQGKYLGSYSDTGLADWASRLKALSPNGYIYFNNDAHAAAPKDAQRMRRLLT